MSNGWWKRTAALGALAVLLAMPAASPAATRGGGATPPRLSFTDGDVSFWRPGAEDWAPAKVNTPLAAGDDLYAGDDANLEVEVSPGAFVRAGAGSDLGVTAVEDDLVQFKLTAGHAAVDARRLPRGRAIEVDTPNAAFTIDHPGYYRVDVDEDRTAFATRRDGQATVVPANGDATDVETDHQVTLKGTDSPELASTVAPDPDEWDRWNMDRGKERSEPSRSARYVPQDVSGSEDLDRDGDWRETPEYGAVWVPHAVAADWAPYSTGRWVYDPYYGWSWVDDAPWGWAPYHYGRWVHVGGYWGWAPGPVVVAPVYSPALVAFFGGPGVSVSVGVPFVSWVALGWGEPIIPWWGPVGFAGRCSWGGWGGPHIVNNVVIQKNVYVNVRNVNVYRNQRVNNAVIAVHRDRFGQGHPEHVRLAANEANRLRPIRGQLGVKPTPASLVPREGRGKRPPAAAQARPVVATRAPQDPSRRLRAAGVNAPAAASPPPRLVTAPRERGGTRSVARPERATPPPHPGGERARASAGPGGAAPAPHQGRQRERAGAGPSGAPPSPRAGNERPQHGAPRAGGTPRGTEASPGAIERRAPAAQAEEHRAPTERAERPAPPPRREGGHASPGAPAHPPRQPAPYGPAAPSAPGTYRGGSGAPREHGGGAPGRGHPGHGQREARR